MPWKLPKWLDGSSDCLVKDSASSSRKCHLCSRFHKCLLSFSVHWAAARPRLSEHRSFSTVHSRPTGSYPIVLSYASILASSSSSRKWSWLLWLGSAMLICQRNKLVPPENSDVLWSASFAFSVQPRNFCHWSQLLRNFGSMWAVFSVYFHFPKIWGKWNLWAPIIFPFWNL